MAVVVATVASGNWTDFNTPTVKSFTPSEDIPVGDYAFFCHGTTVDANPGVQPGQPNYGAIQSIVDPLGNVWTRDAWGPPVDAIDSGTTVEIWRAPVTVTLPATGFSLTITPDGRGMSDDWFLLHVSGATLTFDQTAQIAKGGFNQNWPTGTTPATTVPDELVLGVVGSSTASNINAQPPGWTLDGAYSGSGSGSAKSHAVAHKVVAATGAQAGTFTSVSNGSAGGGCIATYALSQGGSAPSLRTLVGIGL